MKKFFTFATPSVHTDVKLKQQYKIHYDNGILKIDQNEIDVELARSIAKEYEKEDDGLEVKKGQIIGYTGSTGNSYQGKKMNHLHFNAYLQWKSVLPYETFKEYFGLDIEGTETSEKQDGVTPSSEW
ncbi:MAG: M23 family metallopeptidase [Bacteroidota bacterium]